MIYYSLFIVLEHRESHQLDRRHWGKCKRLFMVPAAPGLRRSRSQHRHIKKSSLFSWTISSVLVSCGCLKTAKFCFCWVLKARSPKSRCQQGWFLQRLSGRMCFMPLSQLLWAVGHSCIPWLAGILLWSLWLFSHGLWPLCLCLKSLSSFSSKDTSYWSRVSP